MISTPPLPTQKPGSSPRLPYTTIISTNKSPSGPKSTPQKYLSSPPSYLHPPATMSSMSQTTTPMSMGHSKQSRTNSKPSFTPPSHTPQHAPILTKKMKGPPSPKSPQQDHVRSSAKEQNHQYVSKMKASKSTTRVIKGNTQSPSTTSRQKNWKCSPGFIPTKKAHTKP